MNAPAPTGNLADELASALHWWRTAGVDMDYADDATDWLANGVALARSEALPEPVSTPAKTPKKRPLGIAAEKPHKYIERNRSDWPSDLDAFRRWWMEEESLDQGGPYPRLPPRGEAGAALMIVVAQPEAEDSDVLLSGPQGRLLANMLRAIGIASEDFYLASALPRHTPLPDWTALEAAGLGALLSHHIDLAAPNRLLLFGRGILSLIPHEPAQGSVALREFNHDPLNVVGAAGADLETLLAQPGERARFWRRWLEWTA